ncbi:L-dopachrome tautomerase-related protein [Massilia sp. TN1-12]|uniref:L-dopachrome tautomerase-related protein n=1 Tax=Massilia paldalensis TaxID=3377675 RepID=UPI00384AF001
MSTPSKLAAAALSAVFAGAAAAAATAAPVLKVEASSDTMIWNAVAVDGKRVFVAGPRWTGSQGPALGLIGKDGKPVPYPDAAWNGWKEGGDNGRAFVNVNAIHLDGRGSLWVIDTGSPQFGGDPLPGGAKAVQIDLKSNRVVRTIAFGPDVALPGSYVDDIRFNGRHAYLTDAGKPGLIVVDLDTGKSRRVLDNHPSVVAPRTRPIDVAGTIVRGADGEPLAVNVDPFELSLDRKTLYYGPLTGPWSQVPTRLLDDPSTTATTLAAAVRPWADLPPIGGSVLDARGNLFYTELRTSSLVKRAPDGKVTTVLSDPRLHWVDAPTIANGRIWLPVAQMDRVPVFNGGTSKVQQPVTLYSIDMKEIQQ